MDIENFDNLREELKVKRGEIYTEELKMSVGELISLYNDKEIELEPAFQRLFRWTEDQETNFIESILLGYPIPPVFVLQREDGVWDVIDGVQRLSTIYHFAGILINDKGTIESPLKLQPAEILTHLKEHYYSKEEGTPYFDNSTRIDLKRSAISIVILKEKSDPKSKFQLFKRLNTGGTHLSDQEMRNSMIMMYSTDVYEAMESFSEKEKFKDIMNLPKSYSDQRMDMDIITRFLIMKNYEDFEDVSNNQDINVFLDKAIEKVIIKEDFDIDKELSIFEKLIDFLQQNLQEDYGFRVYNHNKKEFVQSFNWLVFEVLIWGCTVINDVDSLNDNKKVYISKIKDLESIGDYRERTKTSNPKPIQRLKLAKKEARRIFNEK